uniref:Uncharacterized protein n=1 Tax=Ixodes ricinus TaxID=34613 RepID=A0A6B0U0X9_IXORI
MLAAFGGHLSWYYTWLAPTSHRMPLWWPCCLAHTLVGIKFASRISYFSARTNSNGHQHNVMTSHAGHVQSSDLRWLTRYRDVDFQ